MKTRNAEIRSRTKATDVGYRYHLEPDLMPIRLDRQLINEARMEISELPREREKRFISQYQLNKQQARLLVEERPIADFFEAVFAKISGFSDLTFNWITNQVMRVLNRTEKDYTSIISSPIASDHLAYLLRMIDQKS